VVAHPSTAGSAVRSGQPDLVAVDEPPRLSIRCPSTQVPAPGAEVLHPVLGVATTKRRVPAADVLVADHDVAVLGAADEDVATLGQRVDLVRRRTDEENGTGRAQACSMVVDAPEHWLRA